ncbi:hypothetical protein L2E82_33578 [Cichorium intybus]|uniref:Uncharacterized protein n=1 Tax=Cichorium intybus TaxID=13427 RepID=A0ACB9BKI4_CICIN|nr:hypothetical protein L2E82_33578 [Cichorium intybus]
MDVYRTPAVRFPAGPLRYPLDPVPENWSIGRPSNLRFCSAASAKLHHFGNGINQGKQNRMFILGLGFVGEFVARDLMNQGWAVSGTCTSVSKKEKLEKLGFNVHLFDATEPKLEVVNILNQHTHLLISIPPCKDIGDPMLQHAELLRKKLNNEHLQWLCYLSTTSVYVDCGGEWVDENYKPIPSSELAKLRLASEEGWLSLGHDLGMAAHVFRLGGIYGPGRSAIDTIIKRGTLSEVQRGRSFKKYTARIHVADICNALIESIHKPFPGIYNIVDDDPAPRTEVFSFAYKLINEKWGFEFKKVGTPDTNESFRKKGEKRVLNTRMKNELGVKLIHGSYRSGLLSICDQMHDYPLST